MNLAARGARWLRDEVPFVAVMTLMVVAVLSLAVFPDHWRRDTGLMAFALLLGALLRTALPPDRVGMLVLRGRVWDTICYLSLGALILGADIRLH